MYIVSLYYLRSNESFCTQGVLKMRRRVSLMVVTVSAMFAVSWGADGIVHSVDDAGSLKLNL